MKYEKAPLTFEEQADLLISRGLKADREILVSRLQSVNYYRLTGYIFPFRESDAVIRSGTTLDFVWCHYVFDRQLRIVVMDAIERVEVAIRTQLVYRFVHEHGPFGYFQHENMPGILQVDHERWLRELTAETGRSKEPFLVHFKSRYGDYHPMPPLWMLVEVMSFGKALTFYRGVRPEIRRKIASTYSVPDEVLLSWLVSLNAIRNICAHHGRLWNRVLGYKPKLPNERKYPDWHPQTEFSRERIFIMLTILRFLLPKIAQTSNWQKRLLSLLDNNPEFSQRDMGFPDRWKETPLWKE